jgi:CubicO group peptidase (beta-lactamase class C family)
VLTHATLGTVADYARRKLWEPLGAEADATWTVDATGQEITYAFFNAVLRDWGRLGLMLAHDGAWRGKTVVPADWLRAGTTVAPADHRLRPGGRGGFFGYGYQTWIAPGPRRVFALRGVRGQVMLVDPDLKLVLVQTAVYTRPIDSLGTRELLALWGAVSTQVR